MSIQTWLEKYIPVPADDSSIKTWLQATQHAIRKWEGLRYVNLFKEGMRKCTYCSIIDSSQGVKLTIGYDCCALCQMVESKGKLSGNGYLGCDKCPLYRVRGTECDSRRRDEEISPWVAFTRDGDPEPMLFWLRKVESRLIADSNRKKIKKGINNV